MNQDKLLKLQAQKVRIGGKGTPRRKVKKASTGPSGNDEDLQKKLVSAGLSSDNTLIQRSDRIEVNLFKDDGKVIHIPEASAQILEKTNDVRSFHSRINSRVEEKEITELLPKIIRQLGPDSLASLRKLAEAYQASQGANADEDDDEIPDLVENFDNATVEDNAEAKAEEKSDAKAEDKAEEAEKVEEVTEKKEEATA